MNLIRNNKPMLATIISGLLILLGIGLQWADYHSYAPLIFLLSFIIGGFHQAREGIQDTIENKRLNVDILMVLAAVGASIIGYWMEGALLIFIFSLSGSLEEYVTNKSTEAITSLMKIVPATAKRYTADSQIEEVPLEKLQIGDHIFVPKGESVPIDGVIIAGKGLMEESAITGESVPQEKGIGDEVFGSTLNLHEAIQVKVTKESTDTLLAKIIRLVKEAQSTPSKTASFINRIENTYVRIVLIFVPVMILFFFFILQWSWNESFYRGMVLLTVASPCALVASATPATLSAISNAAKRGILFKGGVAVENMSQINVVAFDKTGTLTEGKLQVTDFEFIQPIDSQTIFSVIHYLEHGSTHPIAQAFMNFLADKKYVPIEMEQLQDQTGFGLSGRYQNQTWKIGKEGYIISESERNAPELEQATSLQKEGKTVIYLSRNNQVVAFFALLDTPKAEAKAVIAHLKENHIHTIMITGDNEATAHTIAHQLGIDEYRANCLPQDKSTILKELQQAKGMVAMVGDGINDAPALAIADIGIAMGEGTDVAIESADVVLIKNDLTLLTYAFRLSEKLRKVTLQNIIFSLSVIVVLIISNLLQLINLPLGVIGHEGSTILVILNGLRLLMPFKHKTTGPRPTELKESSVHV